MAIEPATGWQPTRRWLSLSRFNHTIAISYSTTFVYRENQFYPVLRERNLLSR